MKDSYHVQYQKSSSHQFWFVSNGRKNIIKCVQLDVMDSNRNYFHLSLLDYDENSGLLRDNVVSNNGDTLKVLWTVLHCAQLFLRRFPDAKISLLEIQSVGIDCLEGKSILILQQLRNICKFRCKTQKIIA
jgi:hypothetical protein